MSTPQELIAQGLAFTASLIQRHTADLTHDEYHHRVTPKANCIAWILGHLVAVDRRMLAALGATDLPEAPADLDARFATKGDAPFANDFGDGAALAALFDRHHALLGATVLRLPAEKLDEKLAKPTPRFETIGQMANFAQVHTATHAGQISMIRRSLGRPPLF